MIFQPRRPANLGGRFSRTLPQSGGGGGPFDAPSYGTISLWLDGDSLSGSYGDPVDTWVPSYGPTANAPGDPLLLTPASLNSHNGVEFPTGGNGWFELASDITVNSFFAVFSQNYADARFIILGGTNGGSSLFSFIGSVNGGATGFLFRDIWDGGLTSAASFDFTANSVVSGTKNGTSAEVWQNGSSVVSGSITDSTIYRNIGKRGGQTGGGFLYELLTYSTYVNDTDRGVIEDYLTTKYGL